ncbi:venom allergen 5 [Halyomorpha halys]|uniref:venom allergen 5 n=1 Tax=Halyomorpha halys TaxID=286706 RepID=UPI0034D2C1BA
MIFYSLLLFYIFSRSQQECKVNGERFMCPDINLILDYHNELRSKVALGQTKLRAGKGIWVLKWDHDLAKDAQDWADKCTLKHNENRPHDADHSFGNYNPCKGYGNNVKPTAWFSTVILLYAFYNFIC